jgi:glycosyltransferase involved in cell wall biosynthesis
VKVVVTLPVAERLGGAENMLWTFLRHLDRNRIEPLVVFLQGGPFEREVASLGISTITLPAGRLRQTWTAGRVIMSLARLLRRERPDLVLNWMAKSQLYGATAATLAGMSDRVVWWQHGVPDRHWLDRAATLLPAQAVGCSSHATARAQARLRPRRETFVVHPGIDDSRTDEKEVARLRDVLDIPRERSVVGIVGRFEPGKGQDRFLEALAEVRSRGHDVHGLLVGGSANNRWSDYEKRVRHLVHDLELTEAVTFTGQVADAVPYIALMEVLVSVLATEAFGIVLLEAMAQAVAVVAVAGGGPAEIIEHGQSGLLVPSGEPEILAEAIERVLLDEDLRQRMALGGGRRFLQRFTADLMTDSLQEKLQELAG